MDLSTDDAPPHAAPASASAPAVVHFSADDLKHVGRRRSQRLEEREGATSMDVDGGAGKEDEDNDGDEDDGPSRDNGISFDAKDYTWHGDCAIQFAGHVEGEDPNSEAAQQNIIDRMQKEFSNNASFGRSTHDNKYCYLCELNKETKLDGRNIFLESIQNYASEKTRMSKYAVVYRIHGYYNKYIRPRNHKIWTIEMIWKHLTSHHIDGPFTVVEDLRRTLRMSEKYDRYEQNRDGLPHRDNDKMALAISKERRALIGLLYSIKDKPPLFAM